MSRYIIAVGGTGQLALQYYVQQYLLGVVTKPFQAFVVDTADIDMRLKNAADLLEHLQYGAQPFESASGTVPSIQFIRCEPPVSKPTARALMMGAQPVGQGNEASHPANAFFSEDALNMGLNKGLFARPALSSTISHGDIQRDLPTLRAGSTAVVVGSVLGGTGGGLMAPIIDALASKANAVSQTVSLRAVLFGEYFQPDPGMLDDTDGQARFQSNQTLVLRALAESETQLYSYYIAGGPGTPLTRLPTDTGKESLPWPGASEPLWKATQAIEFLLGDQVKAAPATFQQGEVDDTVLEENYDLSQQRLAERLGRARAFVDKHVVSRVYREPLATVLWKRPLLNLLNAFGAASKHAHGMAGPRLFPVQLQSALERALREVEQLFPVQTGRVSRVKPAHIAQVNWPAVKAQDAEPSLFEGEDSAARRAAATLLFHLLHS